MSLKRSITLPVSHSAASAKNGRLANSARSNSRLRSRANSEAIGSSVAPTALIPSTAPGSNAAAITATAFLTFISAATMVQVIRSASTASPLWRLAGFRVSNTAAIGSVSLIRIRNSGETTGTKPTMFMSRIPKRLLLVRQQVSRPPRGRHQHFALSILKRCGRPQEKRPAPWNGKVSVELARISLHSSPRHVRNERPPLFLDLLHHEHGISVRTSVLRLIASKRFLLALEYSPFGLIHVRY